MSSYAGLHPAIGALDVCPLVWLDPGDRDAAGSAARDVGERIGALGVPVFLYGDLAAAPERRERAYFRNGGLAELWLRMESGELRPDHGPDEPHPRAGATLVTARPPLAAFNVELDSGDVEVARSVAAGLRESGGGLPGVRAIGLRLAGGRGQVSTNVHDPLGTPAGPRGRAGAGAGRAARRPAGRGRARRPGPGGGARRLSRGGADPRLRPGPAHDRGPPRLDLSRGPDQEEAPKEAQGHPGRPDRHQAPHPSPQPPGGESPGPLAQLRRPPARQQAADLARIGAPRRRRRGDLLRRCCSSSSNARSAPPRPSAPSCSSSTSPPATTSTR